MEAEAVASHDEMVVSRIPRSHYQTEQVLPSLLSDDDRRAHAMPPMASPNLAAVRQYMPRPREGSSYEPPRVRSSAYNEHRPSNSRLPCQD